MAVWRSGLHPVMAEIRTTMIEKEIVSRMGFSLEKRGCLPMVWTFGGCNMQEEVRDVQQIR